MRTCLPLSIALLATASPVAVCAQGGPPLPTADDNLLFPLVPRTLVPLSAETSAALGGAASRPQLVSLFLMRPLLDGKPLSQVTAEFEVVELGAIEAGSLERALGSSIGAAQRGALARETGKFLSVAMLRELGIIATYDPARLTLNLALVPQASLPRDIARNIGLLPGVLGASDPPTGADASSGPGPFETIGDSMREGRTLFGGLVDLTDAAQRGLDYKKPSAAGNIAASAQRRAADAPDEGRSLDGGEARSAAQQPEPPQTQAPERFMPIVVPVRIDGLAVGDIVAQVAASGAVRIDVEDLIARAAGLFSEQLQLELRTIAGPDRLILLSEITSSLLQIRFDPGLSEIQATLLADGRPGRTLEIFEEREFDYPTYRESDSTTAFVNVFASGLRNENRFGSTTGFTSVLQGGLRVGGADGIGIRGEAFIDSDAANPIVRGEFFAFKDDVAKLRRYSVGDLFVDGSQLQGAVPFAGVQVGTLFALQPRFFFRPTGRSSFLLDRPSTVRVVVDGNPIRTLRLQPGPIDITNLPFTDGANNIQFEIIDDSGITQTINFNQFFDSQLLRQGLHQYSYQAGIRRRDQMRVITYFPEEWLVSGFHRYGLTDELTLGANLQATAEVVQAGLEAVYASPIGNFGLQASASRSEGGGIAPAASLNYIYFLNGNAGIGGGASLQASVDYVGEEFSDISAPGSINDTEFRFAGAFNLALTETTNVTFAANRVQNRFSPNITSLDLAFTQRIGSRLTAFGSVGYDEGGSRRSGFSVLFNITALLGPRESITARYDSFSNDVSAQYIRANTGRVGSFGGSALARANTQTGRYDVDANVDYVSNRFTASAGYNTSFNDGFPGTPSLARVSAASALVFADGRLGVSRPIRDSFVMIEKHPSLADATILVDETELGILGKTDALGPAVIPEVIAYQNRIIDFTVEGLPLGYDIGDASFEVVAPEVGSRRFVVGSEDSISVTGFAQITTGEPLQLTVGTVTSIDRPDADTQVFFTNQAGRFSIQALRPGRYRIVLDSGASATFVVPAEGGNLVRIEQPLVFATKPE